MYSPKTGGFSSNGHEIFTITREGLIRVYELSGGRLIGEIPNLGQEQVVASFTPDSKKLAVWTRRKNIWSLDLVDPILNTRSTLITEKTNPGLVYFAPDCKTFLNLPELHQHRAQIDPLELRDAKSGSVLARLPITPHPGRVVFTPDGKTVFTQSGSRLIVPWASRRDAPRHLRQVHSDQLNIFGSGSIIH